MKEDIKKIIQKAGPMRLAMLIGCGIFLLFLTYTGSAGTSSTALDSSIYTDNDEDQAQTYKEMTKKELKSLLEDVEGVGDASVAVTVDTQDSDEEAKVIGIVIVCQGGDDAKVKREITEAVSALFSIDTHKIKIMKSKETKE